MYLYFTDNQAIGESMKSKQNGVQTALWDMEKADHMQDTQSLLHQYFPFKPTTEQQNLFLSLGRFLENKDKDITTFILTGYAGTGKTSCLNALQQTGRKLGYKVLLLAPTGRAAKIISKHSGQKAHTLHRQLYHYAQHPFSGAIELRLRKNYRKNCLFLVDEASMIGTGEDEQDNDLLSDLIQFVSQTSGNKLVLVGDPAQLPPVGSTLSLALNEEILQYAYNLPVQSFQLKEVSRQREGSGILENATSLRNKLEASANSFHFRTNGFQDIFRLPAGKLEEGIRYGYEKFGSGNTLLICPTNQDALYLNKLIRHNILHRTKTVETGDLLIISRNNYHALPPRSKLDFLANGEFAEVLEVLEEEILGDFVFLNLIIRLPDYPGQAPFRAAILTETLLSGEARLGQIRNQELFHLIMHKYSYLKSRTKQIQAVRKDPYLNALQVKYAYALTCHKAQGGQWDAVFVQQGFWQHEPYTSEKIRWIYTAFTRAVKELYLLD